MAMRCLKCSKIIECARYDTSILWNHIRTEHPEIKLTDDDTMDFQTPEASSMNIDLAEEGHLGPITELPPTISSMHEETIRNPGRKPMYTRKYNIHTPLTPRSPQKRRMYKTSVEKWRPAKGTIYCPKCGANKRPIIRSKTEKMSYSTVGAACILTCWPLCFLPCLFPAAARDYLHCAECKNFLGMYDKQNNCVRPNREFVEGGGCKDCRPGESMENVSPTRPHEEGDFAVRVHPEGRKSI